MPETPRYTIDVEADVSRATRDINQYMIKPDGNRVEEANVIKEEATLPKHSWADFRRHFGQWKNFKVLLGTSWSWFALDIAFYGLGLNSTVILQTIGFGTYSGSTNASANLQHSLYNVAVGNIILAIGGLIPGYYFTFAFIDVWGRKPIQVSLLQLTCKYTH